MTWDELFKKQFKEVDGFKTRKAEELQKLEADPNFTKEKREAFYKNWQIDRKDLYRQHKAEAENYLDKREAEENRLVMFKRMAQEHPDNEYWKEAVIRMEQEKELRQKMEQGRTKSQDRSL